jgi:hypothetical protein
MFYVVLNTNEIKMSMVDESLNSVECIRTSLDGSKSILKFCCKFPETMSGHTKLTHEQIRIYLETNNIEWEKVTA